jgi:hypothetical protein
MAKVPTVKASTDLVSVSVQKFELRVSADADKWSEAAKGVVKAVLDGIAEARAAKAK